MKGKSDVMGKEKSEKTSGDFIQGGSGHMSGPNHAGPQKADDATAGGAKNAAPYIKGGPGHMSGQNHAGPQTPDTTTPGGAKNGEKWIKGGTGPNNKMCGYSGSQTAKPA